MTTFTSPYGPLLANRRAGCCDDQPIPCATCAAYERGVRDAMRGSNLVECSRCNDVHDVRWHVAAGLARA